MNDIEWTKGLIKSIESARQVLLKDERASARYWNGDDWGSISGHKDAIEWVESELAGLVLKEIKKRKLI